MDTSADAANGDESPASTDPGPAESPHWLLGLIRGDVLALTATVAAAATVLALPSVDLTFSLLSFDIDGPSQAWVYVPRIVGAAIALVAGVFGLFRATVEGSAGWVRALAGSAALVGLILVVATSVVWALAPEPVPFDEFGPGELFPPEYAPELGDES